MKTFFDLNPPYESIRVRRLNHSGRLQRLQLYRVINDDPLYYFVMVKGFEPTPEGQSPCRKGASSPE